eukprot:1155987-Pelagomonas_calceolata.AAC.5
MEAEWRKAVAAMGKAAVIEGSSDKGGEWAGLLCRRGSAWRGFPHKCMCPVCLWPSEDLASD